MLPLPLMMPFAGETSAAEADVVRLRGGRDGELLFGPPLAPMVISIEWLKERGRSARGSSLLVEEGDRDDSELDVSASSSLSPSSLLEVGAAAVAVLALSRPNIMPARSSQATVWSGICWQNSSSWARDSSSTSGVPLLRSNSLRRRGRSRRATVRSDGDEGEGSPILVSSSSSTNC